MPVQNAFILTKAKRSEKVLNIFLHSNQKYEMSRTKAKTQTEILYVLCVCTAQICESNLQPEVAIKHF
jgi:hypothetical protein